MNALIETAISLILIFFVFSTIAYVIQELIAVNLKYRSKMLWKSMAQLFDGFMLKGRSKLMQALPTGQTPATDIFYNNPQIKSLFKDLKKQPSYIPAANFALAVMDMVAAKAAVKQGNLFNDFKSGLQTFVDSKGDLYAVLSHLLATSADIKELQQKIENWFNDYMRQVTAWYQSHTVLTIRIIAVALAIIFNVNVIKIAYTIYQHGEIRSTMVAMAEGIVDHPQPITQLYSSTFDNENSLKSAEFKARIDSAKTDGEKKLIAQERDSMMAELATKYTEKNIAAMKSLTSQLDSTRVPFGWKGNSLKSTVQDKDGSIDWMQVAILLAGWLIAAGCISMGAPFWFDLLNKLVNVRRTVTKQDK